MGFYQRLISRRLLSSWSLGHTHRMSTATAPIESVISLSEIQKKTSSSSSPPWLMLPPSIDDGGIGYSFYSLAEKRVLTRPQAKGGLSPNPADDFVFCGSSRGWIALFNRYSLDLFLYNPISLRYIKLPSIHNLPNFPNYNARFVRKVILSCSPDEEGCRAVMIYNCLDMLAFCSPGRSKKWTPIGGKTTTYEDIVYSSKQNLFFGLNRGRELESKLETWDLNDTSSPRLIKTTEPTEYGNKEYFDSTKVPYHKNDYLVVVDNLVLRVDRYYLDDVAPDGSHLQGAPFDLSFDLYPHVTLGFGVFVYDQEDGKYNGVDSLGDLSLFLGCSTDSVALSATRFPELKPNSIYFTDSYNTIAWDTNLFGGHDIGIFNYENNTVSPCYYPCDIKNLKRLAPSPRWFFPTGTV